MVRRALRLRSTRLAWLASIAITATMIVSSPLLGLHGVESALLLGVVLPPFAAAIGARLVIQARRENASASAPAMIQASLLAAATVVLVPIALLALNALRVRQCAPWVSAGFMLLGPFGGALVASLVGVCFGAFVRNGKLATLLAVLTPIAAAALGVYRFWSSPGIFAFGHFAGYFPGTIYDEGVVIPTSYITFRGTSLALVVAVGCFLRAGLQRGSARAHLGLAVRRPGWLLGAVALLTTVVVSDAYGPELGHRSSAEHIAQELGASYRGALCTIHVPRELPEAQARRLLDDCDFRVAQLRGRLELRSGPRVTAFFFRSPEEKSALMGAARTYIAKPWRSEVYLQLGEWPHPVLAHELAHVVAGQVARGPFRVAGQLGGWLPDPGLIEGTAVALAQDVREELTAHEWSRAMRDLDELPALADVMGLSFSAQSPRRAYMAAGSFVGFLLENRGPDVVRDVYRSGDLEPSTGNSIAELEQRWHDYLDRIEVSAEDQARVAMHLERPSIFTATCPHRVAQLRKALEEDIAAADERRIARTCSDLLEINHSDSLARAVQAGVLARAGHFDEAQNELGILDEQKAAAPVIAAGLEHYADALWQQQRFEEAREIYARLLATPMTESMARRVEVKSVAIACDAELRQHFFELLVGDRNRPAEPPVAVHLARSIDSQREDGLGAYLEGRQLFAVAEYARARNRLRAANRRGLPTPRLARESQRLEGIAAFAIGEIGWAQAYFASVIIDPEASIAQKIEAHDWLQRIAHR